MFVPSGHIFPLTGAHDVSRSDSGGKRTYISGTTPFPDRREGNEPIYPAAIPLLERSERSEPLFPPRSIESGGYFIRERRALHSGVPGELYLSVRGGRRHGCRASRSGAKGCIYKRLAEQANPYASRRPRRAESDEWGIYDPPVLEHFPKRSVGMHLLEACVSKPTRTYAYW